MVSIKYSKYLLKIIYQNDITNNLGNFFIPICILNSCYRALYKRDE